MAGMGVVYLGISSLGALRAPTMPHAITLTEARAEARREALADPKFVEHAFLISWPMTALGVLTVVVISIVMGLYVDPGCGAP